MKRLVTTVKYLVPKHPYCNHTLGKSTPNTRCRFCTDLGKGCFVCVLHNMPLQVESGTLIYKTDACLKASQLSTTIVEDQPIIPVKVQIQNALSCYRKTYDKLIAKGASRQQADKYAREVCNVK